MKKLVFVALTFLLLVSISCDKKGESGGESHDFSKTVGFLFFSPVNDWRQAAVNYGIAKADQLNLDYDLKLSSTAAQQESALEDMVKKGIKTVVICDQGMDPVKVNSVIAKGVKVILFDGALDCDYTAYVSGSQEDMGELPGEYLKNETLSKIVAFNIKSAPSISPARVDAFKKAIGRDKNIMVIDVDDFTAESGAKVMNSVIAENPDALWTQDDQVLMGLIDGLITGDVPNLKYVIGGGAFQPLLQVIKNNKSEIDISTCTFSPKNIEFAIEIASNLTKGINPVEKNMIIPSSYVTDQNVDQFIKQGADKF